MHDWGRSATMMLPFAIVRALLEWCEILPAVDFGVRRGYYHRCLLMCSAVAGCPGSGPDRATEKGGAAVGDRER